MGKLAEWIVFGASGVVIVGAVLLVIAWGYAKAMSR